MKLFKVVVYKRNDKGIARPEDHDGFSSRAQAERFLTGLAQSGKVDAGSRIESYYAPDDPPSNAA